MIPIVHRDAYLGLAVPLDGALEAVQRVVCAHYDLRPRSEIHLTIAYLGAVPAPQLAQFAVALQVTSLPAGIESIEVDGVGGAYQDGAEVRPIRDERPEPILACFRVLWLAARSTPALDAVREAARRAAGLVGWDPARLGTEFHPHLTLGSAGPAADRHGDGERWDVHTVPKRGTIRGIPVPARIRAARLHVTDEAMQPGSVHLLREFPTAAPH